MLLKRRVILDSEMNGLYRPDKIWCIVLKDIDSQERFRFHADDPYSGHIHWIAAFISFMQTEVCHVYGHNLIGYDIPNINRIVGFDLFSNIEVTDTLVLSRLFRPVVPFRSVPNQDDRRGGHSLRAWGLRLGFPKIDFEDFSQFSQVMLGYCENDVDLNEKILEVLMKEKAGFSDECIRLEHQVAQLLYEQEQNGYYLDKAKAENLRDTTANLLKDMDKKLQEVFPPDWKFVRNLKIKLNKNNSLAKVPARILEAYQGNPECKAELKEDGSYDLFIRDCFNPKSPIQIAKRLLQLGWKPKRYTAKGSIRTDQETIQEAISELLESFPGLSSLKCLSDYRVVSDRHQKASKWLELASLKQWEIYDEESKTYRPDQRVHGKINPIGAATHRCSHYDDNMANIASVVQRKGNIELFQGVNFQSLKKFDLFDGNKRLLKVKGNEVEFALTGLEGAFGWESRDCWSAPTPDHCLIGADASGIQLRALAHYMNDPVYTKNLIEGDIHEVHRNVLSIPSRAVAKTFIYAWLLGAGDEKIGLIVGAPETEEEMKALAYWAGAKKKWDTDLKTYFIRKVRDEGRKADIKTVTTIIKGFKAKEQFLNRIPALKRLKTKEIPAIAKQGYLIGLDGRKLWVENEHDAMGKYLQGFEQSIMKKAMVIYQGRLRDRKIPFKQVSMVHDEFGIESYWEYGEEIGKTVVAAIREAGIVYKSNCPLDGEFKVGRTWAEVH